MCIAPYINAGLHRSVSGIAQILSRFFSAIDKVDLTCKDHGFHVKSIVAAKKSLSALY